MKNLIALILIILFTNFSFTQNEDNDVQFGFGVSMSREVPTFSSTVETDLTILPVDLANFSFVIRGKNFRIEPSLGYFYGSYESSDTQFLTEISTSNFRLGTIIAYNNSSFESMNFYYGIDIGVILSSISATSSYANETVDESKTDFFIGPAIGGEYMFNRFFSLGGEINLNYISVGSYGDGDSTTWLLSTRGAVYVRWYVN